MEGEQIQTTGPVETGTPTQQTAAAETQQQPGQGDAAGSGASSTTDLTKIRELVLKANPDVVPEMIAGDSFDALLASVEPAKAAYKRIVEAVGVGTSPSGATTAAPNVGTAGAPGRSTSTSTIEELSPSAKIAEGIRRRTSRG